MTSETISSNVLKNLFKLNFTKFTCESHENAQSLKANRVKMVSILLKNGRYYALITKTFMVVT
jgi:hypothetical protein